MKKILLILAIALTTLSANSECNKNKNDLIRNYHYFLQESIGKNELYQKYGLEDILKTLKKMKKNCNYNAVMLRGIEKKHNYIEGKLKNFGNTDPYRNYVKVK